MISSIEISALINEKVPKNKRNDLCQFIGLKNYKTITALDYVSTERHLKILEFIELSSLNEFSRIIDVDVVDTEQEQKYYKALTNLINSIGFERLHHDSNTNVKMRNNIIDEHKRLGNKLNKNQ